MWKRVFDVAASGCGLVLLSPVFLAAALAVRFSSPGPILFRQERVGLRFKPFEILKFRSMSVDAPRNGPTITAGADPRITRVGRVLRKTKIDELPQLINVLKGDMSIVGPRPEVPQYVAMFRQDYEQILQVRPGITDGASLKFRNEAEILGRSADPQAEYIERILPEKIALAKQYLARRSMFYDLGLIARTLWQVVFG